MNTDVYDGRPMLMMRRFAPSKLSLPMWLGILAFLLISLTGSAGAAVWALAPESFMDASAATVEAGLFDELLLQTENFDNPNGPKFAADFAPDKPDRDADFIVVSYNLRYGEAISEATRALREEYPMDSADVILLQEMDEAGAAEIARELSYNYVYYPASVAEDGDNFGNAILSRWPISDPAKLILPGLHPLTGQQRTATRAVVHVGHTDVLVYSTHIEVITAPPAYREAQFAAILEDIPDNAVHVIVGGDFNTVTKWGVNALASKYAASGLHHASADLGPTFTRFGMRPSATDHIFSRGFTQQAAGVMDGITASDHFPIWARFNLP